MNIIEKYFDLLYKKDETLGEFVPTKLCIILVFSCFIIFAVIVFLPPLFQPKERDHAFILYNSKPLDTMYMEKVENYDNKAMIWDTIWIPCIPVLVDNPDGFNAWNSTKARRRNHTLLQVDCPYFMFKPAHNDTITIVKDGFVLKFKM